MPWWSPQLDPEMRKRLNRFRTLRRAWWSLWILVGLYIVSLGAELLCNRDPLAVRYAGRWYFPIIRYYAEDVFVGNGRATRPDYKALARGAAFAGVATNWMVWPPLRFGPNEILDPASIDAAPVVRIRFELRRRSGSVNIDRDFRIAHAAGGASVFGASNDGVLAGRDVREFVSLPDTVILGIADRFINREASALEASAGLRMATNSAVAIRLSTYMPRSSPPQSVRITVIAAAPAGVSHAAVIEWEAGRKNYMDVPRGAILGGMTANDRVRIDSLARRRLTEYVEPVAMTVAGNIYDVTFDKEDVRWPFRPVPGHWLGIDSAGRDVLAQIIYGFRVSMTFGFILVAVSLAIGIGVGAVQGYYGGILDITFQRLIEIWSALPFLYVMILLGDVYGRGFTLLLVCYAIFNWIGISYYMRGEFLRLRHQPFVEAARCTGLPDRAIIFRHILPNALVPVITFAPFMLVGAIGSLAALDYLGFGLPPQAPSWGALLQQAQQFRGAWWLILYPSLALFLVMLMGVLVGEGVRQAYDPRGHAHVE